MHTSKFKNLISKVAILSMVALFLLLTFTSEAGITPPLLLDDFDDGSHPNELGGGTGPFYSGDGSYCRINYVSTPSIGVYSLKLDYYAPLSLSYSGLWTLLQHADLRNYNAVSLWVRGASGGERFQVGLKDYFGNETKADITNYLAGGVTNSWQKATIPFAVFGRIQRWDDMENFSITFLPSLDAQGIIYIDNIMFEHIETEQTGPTYMIDDYNDSYKGLNSMPPAGFWTGGGGPGFKSLYPGTSDVKEAYLHRYDINGRENNAKELTYDVTTAGNWGFYSSNVWDDVTPLNISDYNYLSFHVKREKNLVGTYPSCYLKILYGAYGSPGINTPPLNATGYFIDTDEWQLVNVPLSAFTGLDKTKVRAVIFYFDNTLPLQAMAGTLYVDNLQFSNLQFPDGFGKPESTGLVRIDRETRKLYVDNQLFNIKGVGYQPIPIGSSPPKAVTSQMCDRDFPQLVEMGCNTIRTWGEPGLTLMGKANEEPYKLKVIAGFWMPTETAYDYSNAANRLSIKTQFTTFVDTYKTSPALLMWALGNENNYPNANTISYFYSLCNELAQIAYEREGNSYHPVIIVNGDVYNIGVHEKGAEDLQLNYIDAWGANAYHKNYNSVDWTAMFYNWKEIDADTKDRNISWFELYKEKSTKPLVITEYGSDAFRTTGLNPITGYEDEDMQSDFVQSNVLDIMAASDVCLGGTLMAYSDEWWKTGNPLGQEDGPAYDWGENLPDDYDYPPGSHSGRNNEEWWGIMRAVDNGNNIDIVEPRQVYYALMKLYRGMIVVMPGMSIQTAINSASTDDTIYLTDSTYEEDISIDGKENLNIMGDSSGNTVIKGSIYSSDSSFSVEKLSIIYKDGDILSYSGGSYTDWTFIKDAGIAAINSGITVRNCVIMPDPDIFGENKHGKGIEIWNLFGSADIAPLIENNLILNCDVGVYLYSQALGGAILGEIKNNTFDLNNYGIVLRMHKENPKIHHNIMTRAQNAIHITYDVPYELLSARLNNIRDNFFGREAFNNVYDYWLEQRKSGYRYKLFCAPPTGRGSGLGCWYYNGNMDGNPEYSDPVGLNYYPGNLDCSDKGYRP